MGTLRIKLAGLAAAAIAACTSTASVGNERLLSLLGPAQRPADADTYSAFLIARYASLTNDPRRALEEYAVALENEPTNGELAERAVFTALVAGDFERAESYAGLAQDAKSELSPLVRMTLAVEAIQSDDVDEAIYQLETGRFGPFNSMMVANLRAWLAMADGELETAHAILVSTRVGDGALDSVSLYMLGLIYLAAEQDDLALDVFETVWEAGPRLAVAAEAQARILANSDRRDDALEILQTFRAQVGPNPSVDRLSSRLEDGLPVALNRPTLREGAALALYAPAAALAAQTDSDLAGVYFAMALALDPDLDAARTLWANTLDTAGRRDDALRLLAGVKSDSPFYATARGQMAWAYRRQGRNDQAIETAATALAAQPDRDLKVQLADLFTTLDRDGEADRLLSEIIDLDGVSAREDWRLFFARGAARERLGRWPEAERDLRFAMTLSPDNARILNHLGYGLVDRGQNLEEGLRLISRAADLDPRSGLILDSLGWAYFRLGDYGRAVNQLERAVELEPGNAVINDHLGDAYWRTGRRTEAKFQWRRALALGLDGEAGQLAKSKMDVGLGGTTNLVGYPDTNGHP
ncbi:MAG: tetratricopeptide repeat protein [Pseudomonadota bacterium]